MDVKQLITIATSVIVTVVTLILAELVKHIYARHSLNYKLKRECDFEQKKNIKINLARSKTPLIKAAEELNCRLWNLSENVDKGWLNLDESEWGEPQRYYLRSTIYRFLDFMHWILEAEKSIYSFDFSQADKSDKLYLKYIKTLKLFFCESDLLSEFDYDARHATNHFYKDNLQRYAKFIESKMGGVISFMEFEHKFQEECSDIEDVVKYFVNIRDTHANKNYNVVKSFHLFLMLFLNKYGLDFHYTDRAKFNKLINERYSRIRIKKGLLNYIMMNKFKKEAKWIIRDLSL